MSEEKQMLGNYEVEQRIHLGEKEVVLGVDQSRQYPFMVCYCDYNNPMGAPWPTEAVGTDDYLEAMQIFTDRVKEQLALVRAEQEKYGFDKTPFTTKDCIPDKKDQSVIRHINICSISYFNYC